MPKRKQTDETPIEANVDLSSDDETTEVTTPESDSDTSVESESAVVDSETVDHPAEVEPPAEEPAPKKRRTRKKADESKEEAIQPPEEAGEIADEPQKEEQTDEVAETNESEEESDVDFTPLDPFHVPTAEEILMEGNEYPDDELVATDDSELFDFESEADDEEKTEEESVSDPTAEEAPSGLELVERLRKKRLSRTQRNESGQISASQERSTTQRGNTARTPLVNSGAQVAKAFGFNANDPKDNENLMDSMMWNELYKRRNSSIPVYCKVIGSYKYQNEICAICKPEDDTLSKVMVYVPFSELDIPSSNPTAANIKRVIENSIGVVFRVTITDVNSEDMSVVGSIRKANERARKIAYFTGAINNGKREIIGEGTVIRNAYIERISREGIMVNIYGTRTWIFNSELDYEYLPHPRKKFKVGQKVKVKILSVKTDRKNYHVRVLASVKALLKDTTIENLNKYARVNDSIDAVISLIPGINSTDNRIIAFAELGFNCVVGTSVKKNTPYTVGSEVKIRIRSKNKKYAFGDIIEILHYAPQRYGT